MPFATFQNQKHLLAFMAFLCFPLFPPLRLVTMYSIFRIATCCLIICLRFVYEKECDLLYIRILRFIMMRPLN